MSSLGASLEEQELGVVTSVSASLEEQELGVSSFASASSEEEALSEVSNLCPSSEGEELTVLSTLSAASTENEMDVAFSPSVGREEEELGVVSSSGATSEEEESTGKSVQQVNRRRNDLRPLFRQSESRLDVGRQCSVKHGGLTGVLGSNFMNKPLDCFKFGLHPLWAAIPLHKHSLDTGLFAVYVIHVHCNQFIVALLFFGACSKRHLQSTLK